MLTIRLSRTGKKHKPQYRIVVQEKARDPWSPAIEVVGHYNPNHQPSTIDLTEERIKHWISKGAQPSASVQNMLINAGIVKADKKSRSVTISKKRAVKLVEKNAAAIEKKKAAAEKKAAEAEKKKAEDAVAKETAKAEKEAKAAEKKAKASEGVKEEAPAEKAVAEEKVETSDETSAEAKTEETKVGEPAKEEKKEDEAK
jgi:small subunit ribosomal protein S16